MTENMEDLYTLLQVPPSADQDAIDAAYARLVATARSQDIVALERAHGTLSDPVRRRLYDNSRADPRGLRAMLGIDGRQEKVVWNVTGRKGDEPPAAPALVDPWGLHERMEDEPFADADGVFSDPLLAVSGRPELDPGGDELSPPEPEEPDEGPLYEPFEMNHPPQVAVAAPHEPPYEPNTPLGMSANPDPDYLSWGDFEGAPPKRSGAFAHMVIEPAPIVQPPAVEEPPEEAAPAALVEIAINEAVAVPEKPKRKPRRRASPRKAPAAASPPPDLQVEPLDLDTVTLTTYDPTSFEPPPPPSWWNPLNLLARFSVVLVAGAVIAAIAFTYISLREDEDPLSADESAIDSDPGTETGDLDNLAPPPELVPGVELPSELEALARSTVEGFSGPSGQGYQFMGLVATEHPLGGHFYVAVGRSATSLDGTGQRLFFFFNSTPLGSDWADDARSIALVEPVEGGQIRVVYGAFAAGDRGCCPGLADVVVIFTTEGAVLSSDLAAPPGEILSR